MQGTLIVKNSVKILLCLFLLLVLVSGVQAAETYQFVTKWGSNGTADGQFTSPIDVAIDTSGNVYVVDSSMYTESTNHRVQKFSPTGAFMGKWGTRGTGDGQFIDPCCIAIDPSTNVFIVDVYNHRIQKFSPTGTFLDKWVLGKGTGNGQFSEPRGITIDSLGNVYVVDLYNNRIQKFSPSGTFLTTWGSYGRDDDKFVVLQDVAADPFGNIYAVGGDDVTSRVQKFSSNGIFLSKLGGGAGSTEGLFNHPTHVAVDKLGNVYVADSDNDRVQKFSPSGTFLTTWGSRGSGDGQFNGPVGVAVDLAGNVYVVDVGNHRIQKFAPVTPTTPNTTTTPVPASLTITSKPTGADIFIDGVQQKETTPYTFPNIAPGTHSVIVSKIGYLGQYKTITVSQGQPSTVDVTLESLEPGSGTGTISVISDPPGAGIMLDGKYSGQATPYDFSGISPGVHTVEMTIVGYNSYKQTVTVVPGTTVVVKKVWISTPPTKIVVFVNSNPDGANVYIDDSYKGVTPTSLHLDKGTYILKLIKKDYVVDESPLYVGPPGPITVSRTLNLPDPGFEGILAVISLVAVVLLVRRFR